MTGCKPMKPLRVMQVVDALRMGGAEQVAVNLANSVSQKGHHAVICATRQSGPLSDLIHSDVERWDAHRRSTLDLAAIRRTADYVRSRKVEILHAHGSSLFFCVAVKLFVPEVFVIWHAHYGRLAESGERVWRHRFMSRALAGVVACSESLATWARRRLDVRPNRVWYVPNPVSPNPMACDALQALSAKLPGRPGRRIAHVANLRPEKDPLTLLTAFAEVVSKVPDAHLLMIGGALDPATGREVQKALLDLKLQDSVTLLGERTDTRHILSCCDIGVLSSKSEGLPMVLLEYGMAGLASVATTVGQCADVLDGGAAGMLIPPQSPAALAHALVSLLTQPTERTTLGEKLRKRVEASYGAESIAEQICGIYRTIAAPALVAN